MSVLVTCYEKKTTPKFFYLMGRLKFLVEYNGKPMFSSQGQGISGIEELANYRKMSEQLLEEWEECEVLEHEES